MKSRISPITLIIIAANCILTLGFAQIDSDKKYLLEKINELTRSLELKLLLNKEQTIRANEILTQHLTKEFIEQKNEKEIELLNQKVEIFLSKKQRVKFNILKQKWLYELFERNEKSDKLQK
jgi:hypothetical protein